MKQIKEVLLVLNDFENLETILAKTFALAQKAKARVSLLYVYEKPLFSIDELFKDKESIINQAKIKEYLKKKVAKYSSENIAIIVKIDDTPSQVWDIVKDDQSFLIIHPYHKDISYSLSKELKQNIFIIKNTQTTHKKAALITHSLTDIKQTITKIQKLFDITPILLYNFDYVPDAAAIDPALSIGIDSNIELLEQEEKLFLKFIQEHNLNGEFFINNLLGEVTLEEYCKEKSFDLIVYKKEEDTLFVDENLNTLLEKLESDLFIESSFAI